MKAQARAVALLLASVISYIGLGQVPGPGEEGKILFQTRCAACHTIGGGAGIGPDLRGVTLRRDRDWLLRWIKEPDRVLAEGDPIASQLVKEWRVPMPNLGLTEGQVNALLVYLESLEEGAARSSAALPYWYVPVLLAALATLGGLTAVGILAAKKHVEVRS